MARSSSGKSVARAAATGGGATYRGQMPVNWYVALLVIVLIGLGSVAFAKYHYNQTAPVVQPAVGTTWHAGLAIDVCGKMEDPLAASPTGAKTGLTSSGQGVLQIAPKSSSEAGNNATVGKFASSYPGLTLTNTTLKYNSSSPEYKNGQKCAAGTPDAGKVGEVQARWWVITTKTGKNGELEQTNGITTVKPADLKFVDRQLITVGFVPAKTTLPKPPSDPTITALLQVLAGGTTASTTTSTTAAGASTTVAPSASTTSSVPASSTTSTSSPSTTTTTAPPSTTTSTKPATTTTK